MSDAGTTVPIAKRRRYVLDRPINEATVPMYLGQITYDQLGPIDNEAVVNTSPPGQARATAYANARGVATSGIVGAQVSAPPVYFEARSVRPTQFYAHGYSQILVIPVGGAL